MCIIKEKAHREVLDKMVKAQATKLQPSSKLSGGEGFCKFEGDVLWERPNSIKLCSHNIQCPYGVPLAKLKLFHIKKSLIDNISKWLKRHRDKTLFCTPSTMLTTHYMMHISPQTPT